MVHRKIIGVLKRKPSVLAEGFLLRTYLGMFSSENYSCSKG